MSNAFHYVLEGVDRLSKSTVIEGLQHKFGYRPVIHFAKPVKLKVYEDDLFRYQKASFNSGFGLLSQMATPVIFDRAWLGEAVYSPRYRGFPGDYVFDLERAWYANSFYHVKLILLTTSNFSFIQDDGESFDFNAKEEEQKDFVRAFNLSSIPNKIIVDVHNGSGGFKSREQILNEVITNEA